MIICDINANDCAALETLHAKIFQKPWSAADFENFLNNHCTGWLAEKNTEPLGYILIQQTGDDAELLRLGVIPEMQRHGIAQTLLNHATDYLKQENCQTFFLEADDNNFPAIKLYKKNGFEIYHKRAGYYQTEAGFNDALLMKKIF